MTWFVAGGFPMVFIAIFGAIALIGAARFAISGGPAGPVLAYAASVGFVSIAGVAVDLSAVAYGVGGVEDAQPLQLFRIAAVGLGEALAPLTFGFAVLGVVSLLLAIGLRRRG